MTPPPARFGQYEIVAPLGAGGMGEVYRARDTRLGREVALKLLPEAFAEDADRLARFEREAKVLAALSHPNIAAIFGLEEADGRRVLVMELAEGEDLADRLKRGPMPVDEALAAAMAIAEALEAAHDKGIVHRDLKPANVKIAADGGVKVLDFGLAKAVGGDAGAGSPPDLSRSPTMTSPTHAGMILGTAAYMSPEQARGRPVDKRADIWAFGVLLYEMLTGRRLFEGETLSDILAAVLKTEPDFSALPPDTPAAVRKLLRRCLERDPKQRLHDIADARLDLKDARAQPEPSAVLAAPRVQSRSRRNLMLAGVTLFPLAALAGAAATRMQFANDVSVPTFALRRLTELPGAEEHPALSPDGRQIAYTSAAGGNKDIYLLRVGGDRAINLTAASAADDEQPAISPDGETIAFRSSRDGGGLYVMGLTGESVRRVTSGGYEPAWSPDGRVLAYSTEAVKDVYSREITAELWTVELATGRATRLLKGDAVQPRWSPDGQRIAYWSNVRGQRDLFTVAATGGEPVPVLQDAATDWSPEWSPDGAWLYFSSDRGGGMDLWRIRMGAGGRASGAPQRVTTGVRSLTGPRFSRDGRRLALMAYDRTADLSLYDLDPDAASLTLRTTLQPRSAHWCAPSPDAAWLACASTGTPEDLVLLRADGAELRRLTNDAHKDRVASWSPDGKTIAFYSTRNGQWDYWSIQQDGSGLKQLTNIGEMNFGVWLPSGREMAMLAHDKELYRIDLSGLGSSQTALKLEPPAEAGVFEPMAWSAADRVVGAEKDDAGSYAPRAYGLWDISTGAYKRLPVTPAGRVFGSMTEWLPDDRRLIVRAPEGCLLVDVDSGTARPLIPCRPVDYLKTSRDGRTLLIEREVLDSDVWMLELE